MTDVALTLHHLVPGAEYSGSLTANTKAAFDALDWQDARAKPSWADITANGDVAMAAYEAGRSKSAIEELELALLAKGVLTDADAAALEAKRGGK